MALSRLPTQHSVRVNSAIGQKKMSEDTIPDDAMFWARLARATGASMAVSSDKELRRQWVDDLIPDSCRPSNEGLRAEGRAHLMGHKNGRFGEYRFFALLHWPMVRHPDWEPRVENLDLDHARRELRFDVTGAQGKQSDQPPDRTTAKSLNFPPSQAPANDHL